MTGWILLPFRELVKKFQLGHRLPKADRMVGLILLWLTSIIPLGPTRRQSDGQSVHRASDSSPASVQDMGVDNRVLTSVCSEPGGASLLGAEIREGTLVDGRGMCETDSTAPMANTRSSPVAGLQ